MNSPARYTMHATFAAVSAFQLIILFAFTNRVDAQPCVKPADAEWKKTVLVDAASPVKLDKPVGMSLLPDGRIFLCEIWTGKIKLYTPGAGLTEAGTIPILSDGTGNGLLGVAADPGFASNRWVYVFYPRRTGGSNYSAGDPNVAPHEHVLARMTFADGKLGNLKDILVFKRLTKRHCGGGLAFNPATGDLYLPTGDDVYPLDPATYWGGRKEGAAHLNDLGTAANTNDLRGKVLRIRPIPFPDTQTPVPGPGTTYSIPAGNLYPPGTAGTRPEIYTMGHRNPYKVKIDPVSGFALVGDVGPDAPGPETDRGPTGSDEFNILKGAGNYGWPFAIADNQAYLAFEDEAYPKGATFDLKNLKNKSKFNTGLEDLPPAIGALGYYNAKNSQTGANTGFGSGGETAVAGPYYRYGADRPASKLPAFFHGKFIVGDWTRGKIWSLELDAAQALKKVETLWNVSKPVDIALSADGELFVLTLGTGSSYEGEPNTGSLFKMQYTGAQYPVTACAQSVLPTAPTSLSAKHGAGLQPDRRRLINLATRANLAAPAGSTRGTLFDQKGRRVWEGRVREGRLALPGGLGQGLGQVRYR